MFLSGPVTARYSRTANAERTAEYGIAVTSRNMRGYNLLRLT